MKCCLIRKVMLLVAMTGWMLDGIAATEEVSLYAQSVSLKPVNFSCIDIGGRYPIRGYHMGVQYERRIDSRGNWTIVLPVTATRYNTARYMTDYKSVGYAVYITPGIRYYIHSFNKVSGYSAGVQLMAGIHDYDYSGELSSGKATALFGGVLFNNYYAFQLWKGWSLQAELGAGVRNTRESKTYTIAKGIVSPEMVKEHTARYTGVVNASLGINYRF